MGARLGLASLLLLAACGGHSAVEAARRPHFEAFGKRFGEAVLRGDHLAAYAMTSARHYQQSTDLSAFKDLLDEAREEYGEGTQVGVSFNTLEADGPLGEGLDFPEGVKVKDRRARLVVRLQDGPDMNDTVYEIWLNVIDEDGQSRIVTVEIPGINM
jgi:hypothetical protein